MIGVTKWASYIREQTQEGDKKMGQPLLYLHGIATRCWPLIMKALIWAPAKLFFPFATSLHTHTGYTSTAFKKEDKWLAVIYKHLNLWRSKQLLGVRKIACMPKDPLMLKAAKKGAINLCLVGTKKKKLVELLTDSPTTCASLSPYLI